MAGEDFTAGRKLITWDQKKGRFPMDNDNCCRIVKDLVTNYKDEIDANAEYNRIVRSMDANGIEYSRIMKTIADDEAKHLILLHGIVSLLNESCGCKVD